MAWTKKLINGYLVASEDVLSIQARQKWTSEIDFIPPGQDFIVIGNTAKQNTSASGHLEMFVSYQSGGTFYRVNKAGFNATTGAIDTATPILYWNANRFRTTIHGQFPYYKIKIPAGGGNGTSMTIKIIVPAKGQLDNLQ